jgi:hypothetical protein
LRLSFAQIHRLFEGYKLRDDEWWRKFRLVAYEIWRKRTKNAPGIDIYMPIGKEDGKVLTEEEVSEMQEDWNKHKKLDKKKKRKKLLRRVKAGT